MKLARNYQVIYNVEIDYNLKDNKGLQLYKYDACWLYGTQDQVIFGNRKEYICKGYNYFMVLVQKDIAKYFNNDNYKKVSLYDHNLKLITL